MQVISERPNGWRISPALPTIANALLAVLWGFSTLGGWGEAAFCGEAGRLDTVCAAAFEPAVALSVPPALLAIAVVMISWSLPGVRHRPQRLDALLTVAAALWVLAEGILFVGGYLAKS
ncbi:hypothetical protein [Actinomadura rugatobispora]|uniref:Uncharacterized protein n=1 Tax=Actinomadura rugatobispora TaxID=1994 RepID=A0ABW1AKR8_9ACTN|nr:hypothetical protein GCM10010200_052320 [Actinomadura rugatobispora]